MKKIVLVVTMICLTGIICGGFAQQRSSEEERKARFEKLDAERKAFISKAMKLTDDEKKAFWPLCNELQMKKYELNRTLRDEMRKISRAQRENQTVSEADYKKALELGSRVKVQEAQLEQEYLAKFLQVISAEKIYLYRQSEQNFGERMIREGTNRSQRLSDNAKRQAERTKEYAAKAKERMEKVKQAQKEKMQVQKEKMQADKEKMQAKKLRAQAKREQYRQSYRGV